MARILAVLLCAWVASAAGAAELRPENGDSELIWLIDSSQPARDADVDNARVRAIREVIDDAPLGDRMGLVTFGETGTEIFTAVSIGDEASRQLFLKGLEKAAEPAGAVSRLKAGIEEALNCFSEVEGRSRTILAVTGAAGAHEEGKAAVTETAAHPRDDAREFGELARLCLRARARVFIVHYGDGDSKPLEAFAKATKGAFFSAESAESLPGALRHAWERLDGQWVVGSVARGDDESSNSAVIQVEFQAVPTRFTRATAFAVIEDANGTRRRTPIYPVTDWLMAGAVENSEGRSARRATVQVRAEERGGRIREEILGPFLFGGAESHDVAPARPEHEKQAPAERPNDRDGSEIGLETETHTIPAADDGRLERAPPLDSDETKFASELEDGEEHPEVVVDWAQLGLWAAFGLTNAGLFAAAFVWWRRRRRPPVAGESVGERVARIRREAKLGTAE